MKAFGREIAAEYRPETAGELSATRDREGRALCTRQAIGRHLVEDGVQDTSYTEADQRLLEGR